MVAVIEDAAIYCMLGQLLILGCPESESERTGAITLALMLYLMPSLASVRVNATRPTENGEDG